MRNSVCSKSEASNKTADKELEKGFQDSGVQYEDMESGSIV